MNQKRTKEVIVMNDNHKVAIKFLLWSYFKLTTEDSKEQIVEKCISRAYSDATNQGAYNAIRDKETDSGASYHEELKEHILSSAIGDYDKWHKAICDEMTKCYENVKMKSSQDGSAFTYGNAQKWLNMTVKYLFIVNSVMEMLEAAKGFCNFYENKFEPYEQKFHVPIDSFIIESLWDNKDTVEETSKWLHIYKEKTPKRNKGTLGTYSTEKYKVWSRFEEEDYRKAKKHIDGKISEGGVSPMEWENDSWIRVAQNRRDKEENKTPKENK